MGTATLSHVCLVVGNAHGGSTITNVLIGQHPEIASVGTMGGFPNNGQIVSNNICSCGQNATKCSFWREVKSSVRDVKTLHQRDFKLFKVISKQAHRRIVIDVDHGLDRLVELAGNSGVDLRVVYVQRSLRGVIHSRLRNFVERREFSNFLVDFPKLCLGVGREWAIRPRVLKQFCQTHRIACVSLNYERLCITPQEELSKVGALLNLNYAEIISRIDRDRRLTVPEHLIRGNEKLRRKKEITLRFDDSYRKHRAYLARFLAFLGAAMGTVEAGLFMSVKLRRMNEKMERIS